MLPAENKNIINWTLFCLIFLIWGSSFILMKIALFDSHGARLFTVLQVAAIRIITAAAVLLPVVYRQWKCVPANLTGYIILSGIVGTLVPALLFCYAETKIDSTLAGTLNSLTPVFTILISGFFFNVRIFKYQVVGIILGFIGVLLLFLSSKSSGESQILGCGFIVMAVICYAVNITLIARQLKVLSSLAIVAFSLFSVAIPSIIMLGMSVFFSSPLSGRSYFRGCIAAGTLGILGTAFAWIIFYELSRRTTSIFAATASYGIPFISLAWGIWYGENVSPMQVGSLLIVILAIILIRYGKPNGKSATE
ncbi:DMT family transporter [Inquilinus sp. KBS0705]|nr:DMT family transporter [Inquilinus sp. KBS0705]